MTPEDAETLQFALEDKQEARLEKAISKAKTPEKIAAAERMEARFCRQRLKFWGPENCPDHYVENAYWLAVCAAIRLDPLWTDDNE
jgi:hypothetical protein